MEAVSIIDYIETVLLAQQHVCATDDDIKEMCNRFKQIFLVMNGYFDCIKTKKYHLAKEIISKSGVI